jgi:hypothetical protein
MNRKLDWTSIIADSEHLLELHLAKTRVWTRRERKCWEERDANGNLVHRCNITLEEGSCITRDIRGIGSTSPQSKTKSEAVSSASFGILLSLKPNWEDLIEEKELSQLETKCKL